MYPDSCNSDHTHRNAVTGALSSLDVLPPVKLYYKTEPGKSPVQSIDLPDYCESKRVILVGMPGAYTGC